MFCESGKTIKVFCAQKSAFVFVSYFFCPKRFRSVSSGKTVTHDCDITVDMLKTVWQDDFSEWKDDESVLREVKSASDCVRLLSPRTFPDVRTWQNSCSRLYTYCVYS